jgi:hypothetical protein
METAPSLQSFTKYTVPVRYHFRQLYEIKWGELNKKLMITAGTGVRTAQKNLINLMSAAISSGTTSSTRVPVVRP